MSQTEKDWGWEIKLQLVNGGNVYGKDIPALLVQVYFETEVGSALPIYDKNNNKWLEGPSSIGHRGLGIFLGFDRMCVCT